MEVRPTCSARPRASVQNNRSKGHEWWAREPFHIQKSGIATLCGRDCSEWLRLDPRDAQEALEDRNCCRRCAAKLKS
jgi:hypothetical protein